MEYNSSITIQLKDKYGSRCFTIKNVDLDELYNHLEYLARSIQVAKENNSDTLAINLNLKGEE